MESPTSETGSLTYKDAGVDVARGAELIDRIKAACRATHRPEMRSDLGGFAAMTDLPDGYERPLLVSGTDGVGTKLKLAQELNKHGTVGQDLVAMCANDVLVCGAEPFLFLDYFATGELDVDVATSVIEGIAHGCSLAGCSLGGGETAEMPGFYQPGEYDLAGFCVGICNRDEVIDGQGIKAGDVIIGLPSSGPHSNGYSLIRKILDRAQTPPDPALLEQLLTPTTIYVDPVLALIRAFRGNDDLSAIHGMVHITGGGFFENVPRVLKRPELAARIDLTSWLQPAIFDWIAQHGVTKHEMLATFNCGIGFLLILDANSADAAFTLLAEQEANPIRIGEIIEGGAESSAGQTLVLRAE